MRPFATKARMNPGPRSRGRILGAMPPVTNTPPAAMTLRARLPDSTPYRATKRSSASEQRSERPERAAAEMTAAGSPAEISSASHDGSSPRPVSRRNE